MSDFSTLYIRVWGSVLSGSQIAACFGTDFAQSLITSVICQEASLRIRGDVVFVSSVLFTIAFVCLIPVSWRTAQVKQEPLLQSAGFACLANIFVGLVVTWMGLNKRILWSWWVMFIIVWIGAFPVMVLPILQHKTITLTEWVYGALGDPGMPRTWAESVLIFILMVVALILPIKALLGKRSTRQANDYPSNEQ
jgi:hypothetical protein